MYLNLGLRPVAVFTKTKYMNIHSTIQYISSSLHNLSYPDPVM
jgi:hypothetical protein